MKNLVEILRKETASLKMQYIEMTGKWAKEQVLRNIERKDRYLLGEVKKEDGVSFYYQEQKYYYNTPHWHFDEVMFIGKMVKGAEEHYKSSIEKLALRIEKKGLKVNNLQVMTSHVDVNINTILTDGLKQVKAFTIIASGDIQRPHYRYLIK